MRRSVVVLLLLAMVLPPVPTPGSAQRAPLRIDPLSLEPLAPLAGDVATVRFAVFDARERPVSGLLVRATVRPSSSTDDSESPTADVRTGMETAPGSYEIRVPLNDPGRWHVSVMATDGVSFGVASTVVEVAPRLAPAPASSAPVLFRGSAWISVLRFDAETGSIVRFLGDTVVKTGETRYLVRRSFTPVGSVSRLYGGLWHLHLVLTDIQSGEERHVDLDPVRAALQAGSTSTPAITVTLTGMPDGDSLLLVYRATRLGESWLAEVTMVDPRSGEATGHRALPGALRGTQLVPRLAVTRDGRIVILERVLSLDASGEARVTVLDRATLDVRAVRRWPFVARAVGDADCLANPVLDGGLVATERLHWFAWCRDASASWLGLWDLATGALVTRIPADPSTTEVVPSIDGTRLFLVDIATRRLVALETETGAIRHSAPENTSTESWWRRLPGAFAPSVRAAPAPSLRVALSPDGRLLYVVFPSTGELGDGIWVFETATLALVDRLLPGWLLRGVSTAPDGTVIAVADSVTGDRLVVLHRGEPRVIVTVPERISEQLDD